jgi:ribosomal protein S18 acetylase RimI-like enzyme
MFKIREGKLADYEQVLHVYQDTYKRNRTYAPRYFEDTDAPMTRPYYEKAIHSDNNKIFVVEQADHIVGFTIIKGEKTSSSRGQKQRNIVLIEELCTSAEYRDKGIDHHMFHKVKSYAKRIGANEIVHDVWEYDQEAIDYLQERMEMHTKSRRLALILDE